MAAKIKKLYICNECGYESPKWYGRCPGCGEWNTLNEEIVNTANNKTGSAYSGGIALAKKISEIEDDDSVRYNTGLAELDRVLGGGIVKGSLVLLSGDPGIGKSTILLQICGVLGQKMNVLYVTGEESAHQIKLRAKRLGVNSDGVLVMCENNVQSITEYVQANKPDIVIIDSIQTMMIPELSSSAGSVTQVRECTSAIMRCAKELGIPTIIVGHVNKEGSIAGPKVLEHIVDSVLYFEGERHLSYRILRAVKNRYGSTNEIGVFEMTDKGLKEVPNPSLMLISGKPKNTAGTCITCCLEGSRPILAEVQGLVSASTYGNPRRMSAGFDNNRMAMLLAVLEKRAGFYFGNCEAYVNIVGGMKSDDPATDLAVALALASSLKDVPIDDSTIAFGEIGLGGELRGISHCEQRIKEAERLGFSRCIIPRHSLKNLNEVKGNIEIIGADNINDAFNKAT